MAGYKCGICQRPTNLTKGKETHISFRRVVILPTLIKTMNDLEERQVLSGEITQNCQVTPIKWIYIYIYIYIYKSLIV